MNSNLWLKGVILFFVLQARPGLSWENHALLAEIALSSMTEVVGAKPVKVESLEEFLIANEKQLVGLLFQEEQWANKNVVGYPKIPEKLSFRAGNESNIKDRFLKAIRVNPNSKFALFLQDLSERKPNSVYLNVGEVTLLPNSIPEIARNFVELKSGQEVSPKDVFITAADEPDYGLDVGLWSDSETPFGLEYGFGKQVFGKSKLEFSSQAPFHMGFFHESILLTMISRGRLRSLVEYRIHQFYSLAKFAFSVHHDYWGWRFAGLGAHYVQDLTQPYHTTLMPGESTFSLLTIGALDALGFEESKKQLVERASKEHLAFERFVSCGIRNNAKMKDRSVWNSLASNDKTYFPYDPSYVRQLLTAQSNAFAKRVAEEVKPIVPAFSTGSQSCSVKYSAFTRPIFLELMDNLGVHTRSWVKSLGKS